MPLAKTDQILNASTPLIVLVLVSKIVLLKTEQNNKNKCLFWLIFISCLTCIFLPGERSARRPNEHLVFLILEAIILD